MVKEQEHEFGGYGGRYVPEGLDEALEKIAGAFENVVGTETFRERYDAFLCDYAGRPTPVYHAETLSEMYGADIYLKREYLLHGGAHKVNNTLGQGLLADEAGKERLMAETGAGQHGTATVMVGAFLGLKTEIYMGKKDVERQKMNVFRMRLMGAEVNEVTRGGAGSPMPPTPLSERRRAF